MSNMPVKRTKADWSRPAVNEPGPRGSSEFPWPPRVPGSATIDLRLRPSPLTGKALGGRTMFTPFKDTSIRDLSPAALATLAQVPEGWFVEYKRKPCKPKDYAKAISAFANSRGGWLFVGLDQDPSTGLPAGGPGVPTSDVATLLASVRDAASQNLSPVPYFELGSVAGPIPELGIDVASSILVVHVPESQDTPHIHCSGRIYSRQGDKASPLEISSRKELDDLYARHLRLREYIDQILDRGFDPTWAKEIPAPWVHCAMTPSASNPSNPVVPSLDGFSEIMSSTSKGIQLRDSYNTSLGYIARNHSDQDECLGAALSLEYAFDGSVYFSVPLSSGSGSGTEPAPFLDNLNGTAFVKLLETSGLSGASIMDGTYLLAAFVGVHARVSQLLKLAQIEGPYLVRFQGLNLFRKVPFFNSRTYVSWCESNTVPIVHRGDFRIPWLPQSWDRIDEIHEQYALLGPAGQILPALGVPGHLFKEVFLETLSVLKPKAP
jgi:hypothetical protein